MTQLLFEIVPPSKVSSDKHKEKVLQRVATAVSQIEKVDFINIPEIIDENRLGQPYYRNVPVEEFGEKTRDLTKKEVILNKVVVHCNGMSNFSEWLDSAVSSGFKNFVFVGGNSDVFSYPGPSVIKANKKAKEISGVRVGNIFIPSREKEAERLLEKTISGADFFTSQILFESSKVKNVLLEYGILCKEKGIQPAEIFLSFCPLSRLGQIDFLKWLGINFSEKTEKKIISSEEEIVSNSIEVVQDVWREIKEFKKEKNLSIVLGLNIEEIFLHNIENCIELASKLKEN